MNSAGLPRPHKSLGQHYLTNPRLLSKIVDLAEISPDDLVVEIGAGKGDLTRILSTRAREVVALEVDPRLVTYLREKLSGLSNIRFLCTDALTFPFEKLPGPFKIVANLPYYITTPLLFTLLSLRGRVPLMVLMLQKEVAQRIVASPGHKSYGALSVSVQLYSIPRICLFVSRRSFFPVPQVDSAVVTLHLCPTPRVPLTNEDLFSRIIRTSFSHRRKTLRNSLRDLRIIPPEIDQTLELCGIDPRRRPETLTIEEFGRLANFLDQKKGL